MNQFIKYEPYDYLGKRTIKIEPDKLVIDSKNMLRTLSDDYSYTRVNPVFKTVCHGEKEWGNIIYGLIIASLICVFLIKMFHNGVFTLLVYFILLSFFVTAGYLVFLGFFKRNFIYVLDANGDPLFALKETPQSKEFLKKLKTQIENSADSHPAK